MTLLTEENKQDLYRDFLEEDSHVPHRSIELFAVQPNRKISSASDLKSKMQDFLVKEKPELKCVIIQIIDMFEQYIFVRNNPGERISRLLSYWRLSKDSASNVYKYTRLNSTGVFGGCDFQECISITAKFDEQGVIQYFV